MIYALCSSTHTCISCPSLSCQCFVQSFWSGFDPIRVDTLIAETNSGSLRWMEGLEDMPIPLRSIQEGGSNLDLFVLPDEGISVEEVAQIEASEEKGKTSKFQ